MNSDDIATTVLAGCDFSDMSVCGVCKSVCVCMCMRACVRACVCMRMCMCVGVLGGGGGDFLLPLCSFSIKS